VFTSTQKAFITVLLVAVAAATLVFVRAIACGFKANRDIIIRIEKVFGLHDADCYETEEAILPKQFSCSRTGWTGHFCTLYILIVTVVLMLLVVIWANPSTRAAKSTEVPVAQETTQNSPIQK
jgi:hypothetical protein